MQAQTTRWRCAMNVSRVGALIFTGACAACAETSRSGLVALGSSTVFDTVVMACRDDAGALHEPDMSAVTIDTAGAIVVLNASGGNIVRLSEGARCTSQGRRGRGPGELNAPVGVVTLNDNRAAVLDFGQGGVVVFPSDNSPSEIIKFGGIGEPSSSDALWFAGGLFWSKKLSPIGVIGSDLRSAKRRERFVGYSLQGALQSDFVPALKLDGECDRSSVYYAGISSRFAASLRFVFRPDGMLVGGCTQSDSLWIFDGRNPGDARLLTVLPFARVPISSEIRAILANEAFERFRKDVPTLTPSTVDVPARIPSWRSLAPLDRDRLAVLMIDSITLKDATDREEGESAALPWYSLAVVTPASDTVTYVALPRIDLTSATMVSRESTVLLQISLASGEDALLRVRIGARPRGSK